MLARTPENLREQSLHVFRSLHQVLALSAHLEERRRAGERVLAESLEAAHLEAFAIHARALVDFFWPHRPSRGRFAQDAVAADFMPPNTTWNAGEVPVELREVRKQVGAGIAHISFRRLEPEFNRAWHHLKVAHRLAYWFARFAQDADSGLVAPDYCFHVHRQISEWRRRVSSEQICAWEPEVVAIPTDSAAWLALL